MKRRYKPSVFRDIYDQPYSDVGVTRMKLYKSSKNSLGMVQRLDLLKRLPVHNGCVNSISWNETGDYILSGSDDQHIVITHGFNHQVLTKVKTSHRANIFSAKFLPGQGDRHIVSCSGDGIILFTDLNRPPPAVSNQFSCHQGTAYDVVTVPGDSHSFLSCGEDGTVRWFDLRVKDGCRNNACREDILITCDRAVTSLALNPTAPYQLAVGCSDSRVRLFDRRMLGTIAAGCSETVRSRRPLSAFTVPALRERSCRITSLNFSPDGEEILVSFSSDLLYLFSVRDTSGGDDPASATEDDGNADGPGSSDRSAAPVRRLRLRGDWSDTGPNARPERDGGAGGAGELLQTRRTLHSSLMQRMTDVLSRMLNDPATRANLNGGRGAQPPAEGPGAGGVAAPPPAAGGETSQRPESPRSPVFPFEHPLNESFLVNPFLPLDSPASPDPEPGGEGDTPGDTLGDAPELQSPASPDQTPGPTETPAGDSRAVARPSKPCARDEQTPAAPSGVDPRLLPLTTTTTDTFVMPLTTTTMTTDPRLPPLTTILDHRHTPLTTITIETNLPPLTTTTTDPCLSPLTTTTTEPCLSPLTTTTTEPCLSPLTTTTTDSCLSPLTTTTTTTDPWLSPLTTTTPTDPCLSPLTTTTTTVENEPPVPAASNVSPQPDQSMPSNSVDAAQHSVPPAGTKEVERGGEDAPAPTSLSVETREGETEEEEEPRFTLGDPQAKMQLVDPSLDDNFRRDSPQSPPPPPATETVATQAPGGAVEVREEDEVVVRWEEMIAEEGEGLPDQEAQQFPRVMYPRPRRVMIPPGDIAQLRSNEDLIDTLHSMRHRHANEPAVLLSVSDVTDTGAAFAVRLAAETERGPPDIPFLPRHRADRDALERGLRGGRQSPDAMEDAADDSETNDEAVREREEEEEEEDSAPRHRAIHPIEREMDEAVAGARRRPGADEQPPSTAFQPFVRRVFSGHRNARTMIKEACFWGTDYVMSGSDCGHVFVWERSSGRLVQLLEGDDHVVNCLQPHPTLPLLATSGIDYDVKLWAPLAADTTFDTALADMLKKRNEIMLEETKDTITVPATFMIRMLACLNQIRRGGRRNRQTDDESNE